MSILIMNDDDCIRCMRRLFSTSQSQPKWVLEKIWALNASRSKQLTVGLCLERKLNVCAALESPAGLGVKLTQDELEYAVSPDFLQTLLKHLDSPNESTSLCASGAVQFQCIMTQNGEPGLRISKGEAFVILGRATCKSLHQLAPAVRQRLVFLKEVYLVCAKWVVRFMEMVKAESGHMGEQFHRDRDVLPTLTSLGKALASNKISVYQHEIELEFVKDMIFRYPELVAKMVMDYMSAMDDDDDDQHQDMANANVPKQK